MAINDRLTSYDVDITALASATVRDIHVSEGYAWVLTDTHCYRHPVTTGVGSGTALNIALTSGIGDSRRITGDSHHIYIAYSDSSGDPVVNKIEKRSLATPAAVESTFTLSYSATNRWSVYSGSSALVMRPVASIATDDSMEHLIVHCFRDRDNSYSYPACFAKTTGEHRSVFPTYQEHPHFVNFGLGSAIDGDDYYQTYYNAGDLAYRHLISKNLTSASYLRLSGDVNGTHRYEASTDGYHGYQGASRIAISANDKGFAAYNGVGWMARVDSTDVSLRAYQLSFDTPSTPLVHPPTQAKVRGVEYWNRNSSTNDRYIFLASDTTRKNLLIPYKPNTGDWDYDNLVALDNTNKVKAISILDDVVYALVEKPDTSTEIITYNLTTSTESASSDIFTNSGLYYAEQRGTSFAMRSVNEAWVLPPFANNVDLRRHRRYTTPFTIQRLRNQTNNANVTTTAHSNMNLSNSSADERCFNISNSGNAGSDGNSNKRFHVVYNSDGGWEVWYVNDDTPSQAADVHVRAGNWGAGDKVRGKIPESMTFVHNTKAGNQEIIMIPKTVHDAIRVLHITNYAASGSVWVEQTIAQPTPAAGATPATAPGAPTGLTTTTTSNSITLTWTPQGAAATDWEVCIE